MKGIISENDPAGKTGRTAANSRYAYDRQRHFLYCYDRRPMGMLPKEYPQWGSVYGYFRQWKMDHTWQRIHEFLRARTREQEGHHKHPTAGCLDRQ